MISTWLEKFLKAYGIVMLSSVAVAVLYFVIHDSYTGVIWQVALFLVAMMLTVGLAFISIKFYKKSKYIFYTFVILLSVISCTLWNIFADTQPVSDYKVLIQAGQQIASGNFIEAFNKDSYFYYYNYQTGFAVYIGFIFWIFGSSLTALKILDVAYISLSALLVFSITSRISNKSTGCIAAVLYTGFIPIIIGSSVVNNQHLSTFLMLFGIYMIIRLKPTFIGFGALFIALMNIFRPVGVILLIAIPFYFLYKAFYEHRPIFFVKNTAIFLVVFYVMTWGVDAAVVNAHIAPTAISTPNLPYYKLILGLCDQSGSIYGNITEDERKTAVYLDLKQDDFDYDNYNKKSFDFLKSRLKYVGKTLEYVFKKTRYFLGERDNQYIFAVANDKSVTPFISVLVGLGQMQYLVFVALAAWSALLQLKNNDNRWILMLIALAGFISVYLLIEVQTRYRYEAYLIIIMLASNTLYYLFLKYGSSTKINIMIK